MPSCACERDACVVLRAGCSTGGSRWWTWSGLSSWARRPTGPSRCSCCSRSARPPTRASSRRSACTLTLHTCPTCRIFIFIFIFIFILFAREPCQVQHSSLSPSYSLVFYTSAHIKLAFFASLAAPADSRLRDNFCAYTYLRYSSTLSNHSNP